MFIDFIAFSTSLYFYSLFFLIVSKKPLELYFFY